MMRKIVVTAAAHAAIAATALPGRPVLPGRRKPGVPGCEEEWEVEVDEEVFERLSELSREKALSFSDVILSLTGGLQ